MSLIDETVHDEVDRRNAFEATIEGIVAGVKASVSTPFGTISTDTVASTR